jgi:hypothetical protein
MQLLPVDNEKLLNSDSVAGGTEYKTNLKETVKVQTTYSALKNSIKDKSLTAQLNYLTYSGYEMRLKNVRQNSENVPLDLITKDEFFSNPVIDWRETTVTHEDLKQWMLSRNFTSSEFFFGKQANNEPDYMNPQHSRYSEELAAAVKVWQAMEDENLLLGKSSPKNAMIDWLESRYKELGLIYDGAIGKKRIEDCAKVANWSDSRSNKTSKKANLPVL